MKISKSLPFLIALLFFVSSAYGMQNENFPICEKQLDEFNRPVYKYKVRDRSSTDQEFKGMDITSRAGELSNLLGEDIYVVDSLVVRGDLDETDIHTLWDASLNGVLSVIDLKEAEIKNGIIPQDAFFHQDVQLDPSGEYINTICLRKIILPDGVKRIEEGAFMYAVNLEEINIPSSLQYLGKYAYSYCVHLQTSPLVFPEGFEQVDVFAFENCKDLTGEIIFPSTLREISNCAFFSAKISSVVLPEGLERIGDSVFYGCRLREVWIPNSCQILGDNLFSLNPDLEKLHLPEGLEYIPNSFTSACLKLREINIPSSVRRIGFQAFRHCSSLKNIELPDGLEAVERQAFLNCDSLEQLAFPTTLKSLGMECCMDLKGIKRIYCMAPEPPICYESNQIIGRTPFGDLDHSGSITTPFVIPVFVPVGTAEKYRNAWGWNYFDNILETEDFPSSINDITTEQPDSNSAIYDLSGRKVDHPQDGQIYIINGKKVFFVR